MRISGELLVLILVITYLH